MIVKISVTQDDIEKGTDNDGCYCPIARAAKRTFPSLPDLVVGLTDLFADAADRSAICQLPDVATEFIKNFDSYRPVAPFEFDLDVPGELTPAGVTP